MANPLASGTYTAAQLAAQHKTKNTQTHGYTEVSPYAGSFVIGHADRYVRIHYNPANNQVNTEVQVTDTVTGMPTWYLISTYTAS